MARGKSRWGSWIRFPVKIRDVLAVIVLGILVKFFRGTGVVWWHFFNYLWGALYVIIKVGRKYWLFIFLASECPHPWSPKEIRERVYGHTFKHWKKFLADQRGWEAVRHVEQNLAGATIFVISPMSRGCWDMFKDWYIPDFGMFGARVYGIDVRTFAKLCKALSNPQLAKKVFRVEEITEVHVELAKRLIKTKSARSVFEIVARHFRDVAERIRRSTVDKINREPYGEVAEVMNRYREISAAFLATLLFSEGRRLDEAIREARLYAYR